MTEAHDIADKSYHRYALDVVRGRVVACNNVRLACQRYLDDLDRDDLEFRIKTADKAIRFIGMLRHFKGKSSGQRFKLEPFQAFIVANLTAWYWRETGDRRFTAAYIEMARKGGKTALIAALAMYYFIADGEDGAEVDIAANNYEQAKICYDFIRQFCKQLDPREKDLKIYRGGVELECNASKINVFSADASGKDGFNASVGIIDEFHAAKTTAMRDIIKSSMGMRRNPMLLTITSAGFDKTLPCYKLRQTCEEILNGIKEDDSQFAMIFGLDEGDDWTDEKNWIKSNPNLGQTVTTKYLREQVRSAINNPTEETSVRTKNLGEWLSTSNVWIPDQYLLKAFDKVNIDDFDPRSCTLFGGVDLASTGDLACVSLLFTSSRDPKLHFKNFYYLPESALQTSPNREMYKYWQRTGQLTVTPGNVADYDYILTDLLKIRKRFVIRTLGIDAWNASQFSINCTENGLPTTPISQSMSNLNRPTKELERLIKMGTDIVIDNNEITLFCFRNSTPKYDWNENLKITKTAYENKIDGVVAIIMALCSYLDTPRFKGGVSSL